MEYRIVPRDSRDLLGEGPLWSARRNALFWVDIMGCTLRRLALDSGAVTSWAMPERIGWAIEREGRDDLVIGLKSGFATLSLDPFAIAGIGDPEPERPDNRLNDAKVDRHGRIWAGSKHDDDAQASGALHRLDADLSWHRMDDNYGVANGPCFSPDGSILYHTDSDRRTIYAFDAHADGRIENKRLFLRFQDEWGYPDGMTVDAAGGLWVAHWGGGRISRFRDSGTLDRSIALPATNITSLTFAGHRLDRLFVTSAAEGCTQEHAGALFEVFSDAIGLPTHRFAG